MKKSKKARLPSSSKEALETAKQSVEDIFRAYESERTLDMIHIHLSEEVTSGILITASSDSMDEDEAENLKNLNADFVEEFKHDIKNNGWEGPRLEKALRSLKDLCAFIEKELSE